MGHCQNEHSPPHKGIRRPSPLQLEGTLERVCEGLSVTDSDSNDKFWRKSSSGAQKK